MGTINSNDRIAETLYSLGTWFVSGIYVCINTLHKGDDDDDDDDDDDNNNNNKNKNNLANVELRSHTSRSLFNGLPWFLLPFGLQFFIIHDNLLRGILFTCRIQFLL